MEIEPFVDDMAMRVRMDGPVILLDSSPVLALGLTLHELATNAAKYGALSFPEGRIDVTWALRSEGDQTFEHYSLAPSRSRMPRSAEMPVTATWSLSVMAPEITTWS